MLCCAHLEVLFHKNSHIIHVWGWLVHYAPSSILIRQTLCCSHLCVCSGYFVCSLIHTPGTSVEGKLAKNEMLFCLQKYIVKALPFFYFLTARRRAKWYMFERNTSISEWQWSNKGCRWWQRFRQVDLSSSGQPGLLLFCSLSKPSVIHSRFCGSHGHTTADYDCCTVSQGRSKL